MSAIYINNSDYDKAVSTLKSIDKLLPNSPQVLFQIGTIYYKQSKTEYVTYFDKLFNAASASEEIPDKFYKAFIINANYYFSQKLYSQFTKIISVIPEKMMDNQMKVNAGKAYLETLNFKKSIHFLGSSSLTSENKLLLALAYLKDNQRDKCKQILSEIKNDSAIKTMALDNKNLKPVMQEIINEDKPINEPVKSPDAVSQ
jgi:tetratricopeptide (TPR) repeat protein